MPHYFAGGSEDITDPDQNGEEDALALHAFAFQSLHDGNRPRYAKADHHQHF